MANELNPRRRKTDDLLEFNLRKRSCLVLEQPTKANCIAMGLLYVNVKSNLRRRRMTIQPLRSLPRHVRAIKSYVTEQIGKTVRKSFLFYNLFRLDNA